MTQRIAMAGIMLPLIIALSGCMPGMQQRPAGMSRAMNQRGLITAPPAQRSQPTQPDQYLAGRPGPGRPLRGDGPGSSPGGPAVPGVEQAGLIPGERPAGSQGIPVMPGSAMLPPSVQGQTSPASAAPNQIAQASPPVHQNSAHASLGDGNCEACAAAAARQGRGEIPLPAFRLPEIPADNPVAIASEIPVQPVQSPPVPVLQAGSQTGSATTPHRTEAQTIPVAVNADGRVATADQPVTPDAPPGPSTREAQPVRLAAATPLDVTLPGEPGDASSANRGVSPDPAMSSRRGAEESVSRGSTNNIAVGSAPSSVASSRATMQVQVVGEEQPGSGVMPDLGRPPLLRLPAPPAAAVLAVETPSAQSAPAPAAPAFQVDRSMRNPWLQSTPTSDARGPASERPAPPAGSGDQPAARILPLSADDHRAAPRRERAPHFQAPDDPPRTLVGGAQPSSSGADPLYDPAVRPAAATLDGATTSGTFEPPALTQSRWDADNIPPVPPGLAPERPAPDNLTQPSTGTLPAFVARNPALTTEISGFGQYQPLGNPELKSGQTVLLYCELEGYQSRREQDRDGDRHVTTLESRLVVLDGDGRIVQQNSFPLLTDQSRSQRRDFYMYVPFRPERLAAGQYRVVLEVRDTVANATAAAPPVTFTIR